MPRSLRGHLQRKANRDGSGEQTRYTIPGTYQGGASTLVPLAMGGYAGGEIKLAVPPARATPVTPHARPDTFPPCRRFTRPISLRRAFFARPTAQAAPHPLAQTLLALTPSTRPMPRRVPPVLTGECSIEPGFFHFHLYNGVDCDFFIEEKRSATCHLIQSARSAACLTGSVCPRVGRWTS